jgi:hypothetical protein
MRMVVPGAAAYTQAELTALRVAGCEHEFAEVASYVRRYFSWSSDSVPV